MTIPAPLTAAYAHCERIAREHYENFPVASRLLPAAMRPHVAAVYAFARFNGYMTDLAVGPDGALSVLADVGAGWEVHRYAR